MQIKVKLAKSLFNKAFFKYLECIIRVQIFFGGSSSGKSKFLAQRCIYDLLQGERNYLICRNVGASLRGSVFNEVWQVVKDWKLTNTFRRNKSDLTITCKTGKQAIFKGLDDVEKIKSAKPENGVITDIWVEEATETNREAIKQLRKRMRGKSKVKKRFMLSFNPIMKIHWIFKEFFTLFTDDDKEFFSGDGKMFIMKSTYLDNAFLEEDDIDELESETDSYYYDVYTLGKWGVLGDVIFKNWKTEDLTDKMRHFDNIRNGLDFGFTNDPSAFVRMHIDKDRKHLYIFDGFYEYGLTNPQIADKLKPVIDRERIGCDSAEPKSVQELNDNGINAYGAEKGKDSVRFGYQWLQGYQIIIHKFLQEVINEFQLAQWKKDKNGEKTNEPVDKHNHAISGCRYGLSEDMEKRTISGARVFGSRR